MGLDALDLAAELMTALGHPDAMADALDSGAAWREDRSVGLNAGTRDVPSSMLQTAGVGHLHGLASRRQGHAHEAGQVRAGGVAALRYPLGMTGRLGLALPEERAGSSGRSSLLQRSAGQGGAVLEAMRRLRDASSGRATSDAALAAVIGAEAKDPTVRALAAEGQRFADRTVGRGLDGDEDPGAASQWAGLDPDDPTAPLMERMGEGGAIVRSTEGLLTRLMRAAGIAVPDVQAGEASAGGRRRHGPPRSDEPLGLEDMMTRMMPPIASFHRAMRAKVVPNEAGGQRFRQRHVKDAMERRARAIAAEAEAEGRAMLGEELPVSAIRLRQTASASLRVALEASLNGEDPMLAQVRAAADVAIAATRVGGAGSASIARVREQQSAAVAGSAGGQAGLVRLMQDVDGISQPAAAMSRRFAASKSTWSAAGSSSSPDGAIGAAFRLLQASEPGLASPSSMLQALGSAGWHPPSSTIRVPRMTGGRSRQDQEAGRRAWAEAGLRALEAASAAVGGGMRPSGGSRSSWDGLNHAIADHAGQHAAIAHVEAARHHVADAVSLLQVAEQAHAEADAAMRVRPSPLPFDGIYPDLWEPVPSAVAESVSECADGRLGLHCKRWITPPEFEAEDPELGAPGATAVTESVDAAKARALGGARLASEISRDAAMPEMKPPRGGQAKEDGNGLGDLYEIGDHIDCNKGGWKPGRVVGKHRLFPKTPAWGYDVVLDQGGECKYAAVVQLRPMMEGKCLRFHFPIIPIPPVLVSPTCFEFSRPYR